MVLPRPGQRCGLAAPSVMSTNARMAGTAPEVSRGLDPYREAHRDKNSTAGLAFWEVPEVSRYFSLSLQEKPSTYCPRVYAEEEPDPTKHRETSDGQPELQRCQQLRRPDVGPDTRPNIGNLRQTSGNTSSETLHAVDQGHQPVGSKPYATDEYLSSCCVQRLLSSTAITHHHSPKLRSSP